MICKNLECCIKDNNFECSRKDECIQQRDKRKNVTCKEKRKRYNLENPDLHSVIVYHVDGGMIHGVQEDSRCDYMYVVEDVVNPTVIFIELKGKNIHYALHQLESTISLYASIFKGHRKYGRVVCSCVPRTMNDAGTTKIIKQLKKQNVDLSYGEQDMSECYSHL